MNEHYIDNKIYYHDTDAGGVVYYANYLKHLEEGRTEFCRAKGVDVVELARNGTIFPVVHLEIDYKRPARYGDTIRIVTRVEKVGNASLTWSQEIRIGETTLLQATTVWACVTRELKPTRIPEMIRAKVSI